MSTTTTMTAVCDDGADIDRISNENKDPVVFSLPQLRSIPSFCMPHCSWRAVWLSLVSRVTKGRRKNNSCNNQTKLNEK